MDTRSENLPPRAEALLSQSDWVRKLVRGLGVDESGTEDVLQSTWMAALARPPHTTGEGASLRAWLARVARNFALKRIERDSRRTARERTSAKEEQLPSAADVLEREEARAQVVRALLAVPEPFRTTLLLRFYENLEPQDIARLQKVPGSTVRNRLKRGLELLGERLERDLGPTWKQRCVLVLPLLRGAPSPLGGTNQPAGRAPSGSTGGSGGGTNWIPKNGTTGGGLVVEKIGLAAAALLATGGLVLTWTMTTSGSDEKTSASSSLSSELVSDGESGSEPSPASSASPELVKAESPRVRERASSPESSASIQAASDRCDLRGRLLGPDGEPLKPASQAFEVGIGLGQTEVSSGTAGPSAPFLFAGHGGRARLVESELVEMKEITIEAGPQSPQVVVDDLDASEETSEVVFEGASIVRNYFVDTTVGFEIGTGIQPRIVVSNDKGEVHESFTDAEGAFRIDALRPGRWHVYAEAAGCVARRQELDIRAGELEKHLDVALGAVIHLPVKLVTPDGKDLRGALDLWDVFMPVPFAVRACPNERTRDLGEDPSRRYGSGRWRNRFEPPDESSGDTAGILEIFDPLPLFVGVSSCGFVLESRLIHSGTDEVVFVIDLEKIRALSASVSLRVHSAEDGQPIEGAVASLESTPDLLLTAAGTFEAAIVPPGRRKLVLEAEGYERREEWIDVLPGAQMDLGTRTLGRPVEISGRIVDESGSPLSYHFEIYSLDRGLPGSPLLSAGVPESGPDGTFHFLGAGAGRYVLADNEGDYSFEPKEVDTRDGPVKDIVLVAKPWTAIRVMPPFEPPPDANFVVETAKGIQVQVSPCEGWTTSEVFHGVLDGWVKLVDGPNVLWKRPVLGQPIEGTVPDESTDER